MIIDQSRPVSSYTANTDSTPGPAEQNQTQRSGTTGNGKKVVECNIERNIEHRLSDMVLPVDTAVTTEQRPASFEDLDTLKRYLTDLLSGYDADTGFTDKVLNDIMININEDLFGAYWTFQVVGPDGGTLYLQDYVGWLKIDEGKLNKPVCIFMGMIKDDVINSNNIDSASLPGVILEPGGLEKDVRLYWDHCLILDSSKELNLTVDSTSEERSTSEKKKLKPENIGQYSYTEDGIKKTGYYISRSVEL